MSAELSIGHYSLAVPDGWDHDQLSPDKIVLTSRLQQQATLSLIHFTEPITFEQFQKLCDMRIRAEHQGLTDGYVTPEHAFMAPVSFGMFFSGGDKATSSFGYLCQARQELLTLNLEGINLDPVHHAETFKIFVQELKGN